MEALRQYLLSVTAAALICGILDKLLAGKGTAAAIGKMMAGIFLALTVISPFAKLKLDTLEDLTMDFRLEASEAVADGQMQTNSALADIIKQRTEAYILDKAEELCVALTVQVEISREEIPVPVSVRLQGNISPYAKGRLQKDIEDNLGVPKEKQIWI